jgi:hypothetical protein
MTGRTHRIILYVGFGLVVGGMAAMSGLDSIYAHNPQIPDPAIGRIFERTIKGEGHVYLTESEYEPYRWLVGVMIVGAGLLVLRVIVEFVETKIAKRPMS